MKITEETILFFYLLLVLVHPLSMLIYARCVEIFTWIFFVLRTYLARKIIAIQIVVFPDPLFSLLMLCPNVCVDK